MATVYIKYDTSDVDQKQEFKRAIKADEMAGALFEITHNLRKQIEWSIESKPGLTLEETYELINDIFSRIHEIVTLHDINTEELF
jgi:hypothetical protein